MINWVKNLKSKLTLQERSITFTFDGGPSDYTPILLDKLKQLNVKATFFVVGQNVQHQPHILHRIVAEGHLLGSATWSGRNLTELVVRNQTAFQEEIVKNEKLIEELTGTRKFCLFNDK